ncbi:MAG: prolyl oligopeptidase family serine peptidase, partial [Spirochaetia bacterium]|nr:prolyl oligopeptidase family serine peptidase [Spirochaetia bacterium]
RTEVTGEIQLERYTIEKIVFESRPGYFVTANRYLPKTKAPWPGAVISCGHSLLGKAYPDYQALAARLALGGFAVILYDPVAQGERVEYPEHPGNCVREHIMSGKRQLLLGSSQGSWMAWDGIRALDCLLENKNVDPGRLAAIGQSGGGTLTSTLLALDERYAFGVPSCFITDFKSNLHNELPTDSEQIPSGAISQGLELYDLLSASAPRTILIAAVENDFFDLRGTKRAFAFLKKLYAAFGKGADIRLHVSPGSHGIGAEARTAVGEFLFKKARVRSSVREEEIHIFSESELWVVPGGNVLRARAGLRSLDLLKSEFLENQKSWRGFDASVLRKCLGLKKTPSALPEIRVLRTHHIAGRLFSRFAVNTERDIQALVKVLCESNQKPLFQFPKHHGQNGCAKLYVGEGFLENELSGTNAFSEELKKMFPISGGENIFAV